MIVDNLLPSQDIIYYCNCNPSDAYEHNDYIHFEYHIIDDPTIKPTWCPFYTLNYGDYDYYNLESETFYANMKCYENAMEHLSETAKKFGVSEEALKQAYSYTAMGQCGDTIETAKELDRNYAESGEYRKDIPVEDNYSLQYGILGFIGVILFVVTVVATLVDNMLYAAMGCCLMLIDLLTMQYYNYK
jgi:hypothetical protein